MLRRCSVLMINVSDVVKFVKSVRDTTRCDKIADVTSVSTNSTVSPDKLRLRSEGLVWLIGAMVCLLAAPWVQLSVSAGNGWPHNALRHHWLMPISCHFWDCKALLVTSLTHVSGAIASVQTFTFTFILFFVFINLRRESGASRKGDVHLFVRLSVACNASTGIPCVSSLLKNSPPKLPFRKIYASGGGLLCRP